MHEDERELLHITERLLNCIADGDWQTYQELCATTLTAFEPEAIGHQVRGLNFHRFYFELGGVKGTHQTTMVDPHVRLMGNCAVVSYIRLDQRLDANRAPITIGYQETRVWQRVNGEWKHVHFHRSALPTGWQARS